MCQCLLNVQIKSKDEDKNVDADHVRTGRRVESEKSIDLLTHREKMNIDFRVSGLSHAVVKHAEKFSYSWICEEERDSFSSARSSSRSTTKNMFTTHVEKNQKKKKKEFVIWDNVELFE